MKKIIIFFLFIFIIFSLYTVQLQAIKIAGGTKLWYVDWDPFFKIPLTQTHEMINPKVDFNLEPTIMAGPTFSIIQGDFSLSGAISYGIFIGESKKQGIRRENSTDIIVTQYDKFTVQRYDVDVSLAYRVIGQLRVFAGYKYQGFTTEINGLYTENTNNIYTKIHSSKMKIKAPIHGPGVGLGYTHSIRRFFIGANIAGVFLKGTYEPEESSESQVGEKISKSNMPEDWGMKLSSIGITLEPFIGLRAGERAIMLLGVRYQSLNNKLKSKTANVPLWDENSQDVFEKETTDTFIGVSLSISLIF